VFGEHRPGGLTVDRTNRSIVDVQRPPFIAHLEAGLLHAEHFQIAWATNDMAQAQAVFADRYGVAHWTSLAGALPAGGAIHVELAWVGGVMIELMTACGEGAHIYMHRLPNAPGFQLKLHHHGHLLSDAAQWDALMASVAEKGHDMPHVSHSAGLMRSCFIDAPELGHYLEYLWPEPAGLAFFENVARN
jgi:hypothetical protein